LKKHTYPQEGHCLRAKSDFRAIHARFLIKSGKNLWVSLCSSPLTETVHDHKFMSSIVHATLCRICFYQIPWKCNISRGSRNKRFLWALL